MKIKTSNIVKLLGGVAVLLGVLSLSGCGQPDPATVPTPAAPLPTSAAPQPTDGSVS